MANHLDGKLTQQLDREIGAINRTLAAFGIAARTRPQLTGIGGDQLIIYRLQRKPGQAISEIEKRLPELSEAISEARRQRTMVRLLLQPVRLEVTHPFRKPLAWRDDAITGRPGELLFGRTYDDGGHDVWRPLSALPHLLLAGGTGAGKSVGMINMLLGLCWNTSPADLRVALVDLKNTDFRPLVRLPHVEMLATDIAQAAQVFRTAGELLLWRQQREVSHPLLLILVDEYTDLIEDAETMKHADRVARQGRSAGEHMVIATQHPTSKALGGATIKNNFLTRVVGQVADANAANNAAGRPGTHAELLPDKGAFLLVRGGDILRYQSYFITANDIESLITRISRKWRETRNLAVLEPPEPVQRKNRSSLVVEPPRTAIEPILEPPSTVLEPFVEPLAVKRPLTPKEAVAVSELYQRGLSKTAICRRVYGSKNGTYAAWIDEALVSAVDDDGKVIKLRKAR